ncbi:MAG: S41 family peptidase [Clostridia bacterium]|nr:S41 family peptidase [Clostridia bacterium]
MEEKKKMITAITITALATCLLTNTVRDLMYVQDNGVINNKVSKIAKIINDYCIFDLDKEKMSDYAASGLTLAVDDQYTNYYTKQQFESYKTNLSNSFYGIGIVISVDAEVNKLVVVSAIEGGPSAKAGILSGDYITAVDGVEYTGDEMDDAVSVMRGDDLKEKKGTKVTVTVERGGQKTNYEITRDIVKNDSVSEKMLDDGIGYIRITAFNSADENDEEAKDTYDEFMESLNNLKEGGMKKLIIDLRNNPGGSLTVVNKIADELLPEGIITYTEDKKGSRTDYSSKEGELNIPMAVLVNGNSASASEVLTGALKDYKKATIIGEKTFGKGIVQSVIPLGDGSGISVTTAKYFSPNGVCIHGVGIEPDIVVEMDNNKQISDLSYEEDIQLKKAVEVLQ